MKKGIVKGIFGNCSHCKTFANLDREGLCAACSTFVLDQIDRATQMIIENPELTREEISDSLGVSIECVNQWIQSGRVRCVVVRYTCPTCHRTIVNRMICSHCGYTPKSQPEENPKPRIRSNLMESILEERFSRQRKRLTHRLRLMSTMPKRQRADPVRGKSSK